MFSIQRQQYSTKCHKNLLYICICAGLMGLPFSAISQSTDESVDEGPDDQTKVAAEAVLEEVVVSGIRSAYATALDEKRRSGNVVDAIIAEDIGKSTDQNIAEALQRVTGVSINRSDGEGTSVVVRGTPADLNVITLNGVPLSTGGANQGVDLSQFSADFLSSIEVIKTSSADHDEGSLGATIRLTGFSPLDQKKNRRVVDVQARYNDFADKTDPKYVVSLSEKLAEETVGLSLVVIGEKTTSRKDQVDVGNGYQTSKVPAGAVNIETGELITEFDYGDGNGLQPLRALSPQGAFYTTDRIEQDRFTATGTIQWQPSDQWNVKFDLTYASQDIDRSQNRINTLANLNNRAPQNPDLVNNLLFDPQTFTLVRNIMTAEDVNSGQRNREDAVMITDIERQTEQDTWTYGGLVEYFIDDDWTLALSGGHSETTFETPFNYFVRFNNNRPRRTGNQTGFDCGSTPELCQIHLSDGYMDDPTRWLFQTSSLIEDTIDDDTNTVFFDVDWNKSFGPIIGFEAGLKYQDRRKNVQSSNTRYNNAETDGVLTDGLTMADFWTGKLTPSDFGASLGLPRDQVSSGWYVFDGAKVLEVMSERFETPVARPNIRNTRDIAYDVFGTYLKANFEFSEGTVFGDIGVRYVKTNNTSKGFSGYDFNPAVMATPENIDFFGSEQAVYAALGRDTLDSDAPATPTIAKNDYSNFLPSFNINWALNNTMVTRFAASKTMARPRIDSLKPGFTITERIFDPQSNAVFGSPNLEPFVSRNLDLTFEWYFTENSLLSIAVFDKDLQDFEESNSFQAFWVDNRAEFYDEAGNPLPADQINFVADANTALLPFDGGPNQSGCMPNRERDYANLEGAPGCDLVVVSQSRNGTGGYVRGVELIYQQDFSHLSGFWSGFGVQANYTYSDSQADEEVTDSGEVTFPETPLLETSEHTYNATAYYETDKVQLRLAYNYRSEYLVNRNTRNNNAEWVDEFDTLDFSAAYNIGKYVTLNFQAQNLTDSETRFYTTIGNTPGGIIPQEPYDFGGITSRTRRVYNTGRIYRLGIRVSW